MPALLALIPEIVDALAAFIGATWWQLPVFIGLWKVQDAASSAPAPPAQQTPIQTAVSGAATAVGGAGQAVGGTGAAVGGFGQFIHDNPWVIVGGLVALVVLRR